MKLLSLNPSAVGLTGTQVWCPVFENKIDQKEADFIETIFVKKISYIPTSEKASLRYAIVDCLNRRLIFLWSGRHGALSYVNRYRWPFLNNSDLFPSHACFDHPKHPNLTWPIEHFVPSIISIRIPLSSIEFVEWKMKESSSPESWERL